MAHRVVRRLQSRGSVTGPSYLHLPDGGYVSTPDTAGFSITGDVDLRVAVALNDWTPATDQYLLGKGATDYGLLVLTTGVLQYSWHNGTAAATLNSSVAPTVSDGALLLLRVHMDVDNGSAGHDVRFYTKTSTVADAYKDTFADTGWSQLGTTRTGVGTTSHRDTANAVTVGAASDGSSPSGGKVYAAYFKGASVISAVNFSRMRTGVKTFSDTYAHVWTVQPDAAVRAS